MRLSDGETPLNRWARPIMPFVTVIPDGTGMDVALNPCPVESVTKLVCICQTAVNLPSLKVAPFVRYAGTASPGCPQYIRMPAPLLNSGICTQTNEAPLVFQSSISEFNSL